LIQAGVTLAQLPSQKLPEVIASKKSFFEMGMDMGEMKPPPGGDTAIDSGDLGELFHTNSRIVSTVLSAHSATLYLALQGGPSHVKAASSQINIGSSASMSTHGMGNGTGSPKVPLPGNEQGMKTGFVWSIQQTSDGQDGSNLVSRAYGTVCLQLEAVTCPQGIRDAFFRSQTTYWCTNSGDNLYSLASPVLNMSGVPRGVLLVEQVR
jgi:hypothetical protein